MIDPRAFREATRTVSISYPVPFIVVSLLGFALSSFVLLHWVGGAAELVITIAGGLSALMAMGLAGYAVLRKPEPLRSERHILPHSYLEWLAAGEPDESTRESASKVIMRLSEPEVPKRLPANPEPETP